MKPELEVGMIVYVVGGLQIRRGLYAKIIKIDQDDNGNNEIEVLFPSKENFVNYSRMIYYEDDLKYIDNWRDFQYLFEDQAEPDGAIASSSDNSSDPGLCDFCRMNEISRRVRVELKFKSGDIHNLLLCEQCLESKSLEIEKISKIYD